MQKNLVGKRVNGLYMGLFPYRGIVVKSVESRGSVHHQIQLSDPIVLGGVSRSLVEVSVTEINRILDERDAAYARSINDTWFDDTVALAA